jgi:hypothetical protein
LTIHLLTKFDFGHPTLKQDIFDHPTITATQIWPLGYFMGDFIFHLQLSP